MTGTTKDTEIDRMSLLYEPMVLEQMQDRYGQEVDIKRHVKTTAKVYEIRTALRYWFGGQPTHRTSDAVWKRLRLHEEGGVPPEECERL